VPSLKPTYWKYMMRKERTHHGIMPKMPWAKMTENEGIFK